MPHLVGKMVTTTQAQFFFCIRSRDSHHITIDEVQNQSFIMECTSSKRRVMLVDACGNKFQTQKAFNYKKIDTQLQIYLLCQHSFRVRVRICMVAVLLFVILLLTQLLH